MRANHLTSISGPLLQITLTARESMILHQMVAVANIPDVTSRLTAIGATNGYVGGVLRELIKVLSLETVSGKTSARHGQAGKIKAVEFDDLDIET